MATTTPELTIDTFIARWTKSGGAERANFAPFIAELCAVLEVPPPDPTLPDDADNAYVFERAVTFNNPDGSTSAGRIDLYRRGCFVMEAKQGSEGTKGLRDKGMDVAAAVASIGSSKATGRSRRGTAVRGTAGWDEAMIAARGQAEKYVRALPAGEGNPPFIVVVDVGHTFELFADFSRSGKTYVPFPDARNHRIRFQDIATDEVRTLLRTVWTEPMSLDPSRHSAKVTRDVADRLAVLARSLEASGQKPEAAAQFLMRCIFTMFAEDVKLIPERAFTQLLEDLRQEPEAFVDNMRALWSDMDRGGFSGILRKKLLRFNGGLFQNIEALPLTKDQLELLIDAGKSDWHDVEPAIFGTLLERALDPIERHKLGAHYTPRAYVERLVMPTIVEPLREEWDATRAATVALMNNGDRDEAVRELKTFHHRLCTTRVLDPACGTGNFLYVTLEHLKRLEGEVLDTLHQLGESTQSLELTELTVDPHQLLGIEINPRAAAIADLVLWIGYLQWHFRTHGDALPREPVLHQYNNIENRDALLEYDAVEPQLDEHGEPVTRWDGRTMKKHPVTGEDVPDETARVPVMRYVNPRKAEWPEAEFIVGNPPFLGVALMRQGLGDGYTTALRNTYADLPSSVDIVMYWWQRSAQALRGGSVRRFGLITTNSLRQAFNRRVVAANMEGDDGLSLVYAIPDHPWVDASDGADVRIAITVAERGLQRGVLDKVISEATSDSHEHGVVLARSTGRILPHISIGPDVAGARSLRANTDISNRGVSLFGSGFIINLDEARELGFGRRHGLSRHIRPYRNGRDLAQRSRDLFVIDLTGLSAERVRSDFPEVYQWVFERVKPERDVNNRPSRREKWWLFGETNPKLRDQIKNIRRYIATPETSKHRFFVFLDAEILPDNKLVNIALESGFHLGVLSSVIHSVWAVATGSRLGVGNDLVYVKSACFETYPFPSQGPGQVTQVEQLAEQLDAHRKRQQSLHPMLTITDMYNVLEKLRRGATLTAKEKKVHEEGLVSVLQDIHDDLDRVVLLQYGWDDLLPLLPYDKREEFDEVILSRLVALNHERAEEEARGLIRWLRAEYQARDQQGTIDLRNEPRSTQAAVPKPNDEAFEKLQWPKAIKEQTLAVRSLLAASGELMSVEEIAKRFSAARVERVGNLLHILEALGIVREVEAGRYVG